MKKVASKSSIKSNPPKTDAEITTPDDDAKIDSPVSFGPFALDDIASAKKMAEAGVWILFRFHYIRALCSFRIAKAYKEQALDDIDQALEQLHSTWWRELGFAHREESWRDFSKQNVQPFIRIMRAKVRAAQERDGQ